MANNSHESHRFLFIAGLHRSGTSILFRCLREHPQISGFRNTGVPEDEGQHLQKVYLPASAYGGPGKFGFQSEAALTEASPLVSDEARRQLFASWSKYWDLAKPVLLEKSPPNLIRMRFLQALFPESYFVVLLRDPIAVCFATQKWSNTSIESLIEHWVICHERFEQDKPYLKRLLILRYEDFVKAPQTILETIHRFVGVTKYPNTLRVRADIHQKYTEMWRQFQVSDSGIQETRQIKHRYTTRAGVFGYRLQ
jgi:sulfotransferase family protein